MTTTKTTAAKKFAWNEETSLQAINLYAALLGGTYNAKSKEIDYPEGFKPSHDIHAAANAEAALNKIAAEIGAKSGRAVRGKLAKEGVYIALEPQAAPSTSSRISKGQYVRSIAKGLGLDMESVQTLDKANLEALETLTSSINKVLSAAGYDIIEIK